MPTESQQHISGTLGVAAVLAAAAGFVDAYIFVHVTPVFVANMSGNLVRLGMASGTRDGHAVASAALALVAFSLGVVAATTHIHGQVRAQRRPTASTLLFTEAVAVAVVAAVMHLTAVTYSATITWSNAWIVASGAFAMGMQAVTLRRVGEVAVSTTYGTGAVVRLGEKLALAARKADRPDDSRRRVTIIILASVLLAYVVGAGLASATDGSSWWLLAPAVAQGAAAVRLTRG